MTWKQFFHAIEVDSRRARRAAIQRQRTRLRHAQQGARDAARHAQHDARETAKLAKQMAKEQLLIDAANEVEQYERYMEALVSLHKDCGDSWDWHAVAQAPAPWVPQYNPTSQQIAEQALAAYQPGLMDRMTGAAKTYRTQLELNLAHAVATETARYQAAAAHYQQDQQVWETNMRLAPGVLQHHPDACGEALRHAFAFDDVERFGTAVKLTAVATDVATLAAVITNDDLVPRKEVTQTKAGKLSEKAVPDSRYWTAYQDHVCSCALRIASEALAVLPVHRAIVNVQRRMLDPSTGHWALPTILAVHVARADLDRINLDAVDPAAAMKNFPHRMTFKKTTGFAGVEPITADEQWASS